MNNNYIDPKEGQEEATTATETQPAEGTSEAIGTEATGEGALVD